MPPSEVSSPGSEAGRWHPITEESRQHTGEPRIPRLLCDEVNPIVLVFDGAGDLLRWSPSFAERTPPRSSPAGGERGASLAPEERTLIEHLLATARAGQSQRARSARRDGVECAWSVIPLTSPSGRVELTVVTGIERERGARSSGPPESPDSALVAGHLPMWAFDRRTLRFVAANDQALRRVGYSRGDFLSARLTDILPWERVPAVVDLLTDMRPEAETAFREGSLRKDRSLIALDATVTPTMSHGRPLCAAVLSDVREPG